MSGVIKRIRIPRENLPPTLVVENNSRTSFAISGVISTTNAGNPVYEYTTTTDHGFQPQDFITITGIVDSDGQTDADGNPISTFNFVNAPVLDTPTNTTFQVLVDSPATVTYVSGGQVAENSGLYVVRYRIVSEDRNRVSHWSPQYVLSPSSVVDDPGLRIVQNQVSGESIVVVWELPKDYKDRDKTDLGEFDVYVAWGATINGVGIYEYYTTVTGNSATVTIPLDQTGSRVYSSYKIAIQNRTSPTKRRIADLTVAETALSFL